MNEDMNRTATYGDIQRLDQKIDSVDRKLDGKFSAQYAKLYGTMWDMEDRITRLMTRNHHELMGVVLKFHDDVERVDHDEVILKDKVQKLEGRVTSLEQDKLRGN